MRAGFDIDGVLAQFNDAYAAILTKVSGVKFPPESDDYPAVWYWEREEFANQGYDKKMADGFEDAAWDRISSTDFWGGLHAYPGALDALNRMRALKYEGHDFYFITSRSGYLAKFYTEMWLSLHGMSNPTVLIAMDKGPIIKALKLDVFVDDKVENVLDALEANPTCRVYVIDRPWNRPGEAMSDPLKEALRVKSINTVMAREFPVEMAQVARKAA